MILTEADRFLMVLFIAMLEDYDMTHEEKLSAIISYFYEKEILR